MSWIFDLMFDAPQSWNKIRFFSIIKTVKFRRNTKRIFTAALAIWMSGIVLFLCCQMPMVKAADTETVSCPLAKKGDCGKMSEENSGESFDRESKTFDCCAFPAKVFDKARKIEVQPHTAEAAATIKIVAPQNFVAEKTFKTAKFYQSFIRNRLRTHLNNCVFRI